MNLNLDKPMPASLDAERSILGAVLLENLCYYQAANILRPVDFSLAAHRSIFVRMGELLDTDVAVDIITLTEILKRNREIEKIGGVAYLSSLTEGLPRRENIEHYAHIVRDKSMLRNLVHASTVTIAKSLAMEEPADIVLADAHQKLTDITNAVYKERTLQEIAVATMNKIEELCKIEGDCIGATTSIPDLDLITTGYRDEELAVIGGRPGNGKTGFVCQGIRANCELGRKVGFFSCEVPEDQIMIRMACMDTGIPVFETRDPRMLEMNRRKQKLQEAIADIGHRWKDRFFLDCTPCIDLNQLCARARAWASKGVDLIFVDYLQILTSEGKSEYEQVTNSIKRLWHLERSLKIKLVALSQLGRDKTNARPTMADLRGSGMIENFANVIFLLWRDLEIGEDGELLGMTGKDEIIMPKQRSGPSQVKVNVTFDGPVGMWKPRNASVQVA
jgi:replicative DNA helicase